MKSLRVPSALGALLFRPILTPTITAPGLRLSAKWEHTQAKPSSTSTEPVIPAPTPLVPDVETFLKLIGRDMKQHASKFPSWESLFTLSTGQLKELGLEPPRARKYLARWRQRFREQRFGIAGDFKHIQDGKAHLKVYEIIQSPLKRLKRVVNLPADKNVDDLSEEELQANRVKGYKVSGVRTIVGPYAMPAKGGGAIVEVTEGMWEDKRGHKVDGGERRKEEVRFLKRLAERKALREQQGFY